MAQDLLHLVELGLSADQRGSDLDDGIAAVVNPAIETVLERRSRNVATQHPFHLGSIKGLLGRLVLDQLYGVEVAVATYVADDRQVIQLLQCLPETVLLAQDVAEQILALEKIKVGQRHRTRRWVTAERITLRESGVSLGERLENGVGDDRCAQRGVARGQIFGTGD